MTGDFYIRWEDKMENHGKINKLGILEIKRGKVWVRQTCRWIDPTLYFEKLPLENIMCSHTCPSFGNPVFPDRERYKRLLAMGFSKEIKKSPAFKTELEQLKNSLKATLKICQENLEFDIFLDERT